MRAMPRPTDPATSSGYGHPSYAASLVEFGTARRLPRSGGWVLERRVPDTDAHDAMGCYPLFVCQDWRALQADLDDIDELVSVALVTDPFGDFDQALLRRAFHDVVTPFKAHFVTDLRRPFAEIVSRHHRYYARKALERVSVERCDAPDACLDDWVDLYAELRARHNLRGITAFSREAFARQLYVPGLVMFRAVCDGATVGAHLWYKHGDVAQSHLAAVSARGYEVMASYALHARALEAFADEVSWLNLGSGAGLAEDGRDGLTAFKRGWATGTRQAYFCGRVFDPIRYEALAAPYRERAGDYFPAYRYGEFS
jgi:hypothetical protein